MLESESAVIGALLIDPEPVLPIISSQLTEDDFEQENNRSIFSAALRLQRAEKTIDAVSLCTESKVPQSYIMELMNYTPTAAYVQSYIDGTITASIGRRLLLAAKSVEERIVGGEAPESVCGWLHSETENMAETRMQSDVISSLDACTEFFNDISGGKRQYIGTGYDNIDRVMKLVNGGLYILAARPGCGKTTLALQIADKVAKAGNAVLFVSLEMTTGQISAKRIATQSGVPYDTVYNGTANAEEWEKITMACGKISEWPVYINRRDTAKVSDIEFMARNTKGLSLVIIDYLGLIRQPEGKSLYEKTTCTSGQLKHLAKTLNVPVICLAQLNREVEGRQGERPRLADLRDSGAIEQDADGVMMLYRNMDDDAPETNARTLQCYIAKNRHGKMGDLVFQFFLNTGIIVSAR